MDEAAPLHTLRLSDGRTARLTEATWQAASGRRPVLCATVSGRAFWALVASDGLHLYQRVRSGTGWDEPEHTLAVRIHIMPTTELWAGPEPPPFALTAADARWSDPGRWVLISARQGDRRLQTAWGAVDLPSLGVGESDPARLVDQLFERLPGLQPESVGGSADGAQQLRVLVGEAIRGASVAQLNDRVLQVLDAVVPRPATSAVAAPPAPLWPQLAAFLLSGPPPSRLSVEHQVAQVVDGEGNAEWVVAWQVLEDERLVLATAVFDARLPSRLRPMVPAVLNQLNLGLRYGSLELDFHTGQLSLRAALCCGDGDASPALLRAMQSRLHRSASRVVVPLEMLAEGQLTVDQLLDALG